MCGCWSCAVSLISRRKLSAPIDCASSGRSTFTATERAYVPSRARYTTDVAPRPSSWSTVYRPANAPDTALGELLTGELAGGESQPQTYDRAPHSLEISQTLAPRPNRPARPPAPPHGAASPARP